VEALSRDLGVSKGSFYWHFQDREDLLAKMMSQWEQEETEWLTAEADRGSAATRWAKFVERTAQPQRIRVEVAMRAWARRDERVSAIVTAMEKKKTAVIAQILREIGFAPPAAESWSDVVLLVCLGWVDRAARDGEFQSAGRGLSDFLSEMLLAASSPPATR
jgi:AcrR family transcriptional regulator